MKSFDFGRFALSIGVAAAMLVGCGGSQPTIGAPGAVPLNDVGLRHAAEGGNLIYVGGAGVTYILNYDTGAVINSFNETAGYGGLCSDKKGNVFMPNVTKILEFAHGDTSPSAELGDGNFRPLGCSVDPVTGNLAVANIDSGSGSKLGSIAVFKKSSGSPTFYNDPNITSYFSCGYDNSGNLFLDGSNASTPFIFAELPVGSSTFQEYALSEPVKSPGSVQWDGRYVAVGAYGARHIYRVKVAGSSATIVSAVTLETLKTPNFTFWLQGSSVLTAANPHRGSVGIWKYPRGGKPYVKYAVLSKGELGGITVSVSPKGSREP
jgi:hypothetical protein